MGCALFLKIFRKIKEAIILTKSTSFILGRCPGLTNIMNKQIPFPTSVPVAQGPVRQGPSGYKMNHAPALSERCQTWKQLETTWMFGVLDTKIAPSQWAILAWAAVASRLAWHGIFQFTHSSLQISYV